MTYKAEVWQYGFISEVYETDDLHSVKDWFMNKWSRCWSFDECYLLIYENDRGMDFEELYDFGFYG